MRILRWSFLLFFAVVTFSLGETITPANGYVWDAVQQPAEANTSFHFEALTENPDSSSLTFLVTPSTAPQDLILTVCFTDTDQGFLKVSWQTGTTTTVLTQNLNEGLNASHHRVLLINRNLLQEPGILAFESNRPKIPVWRVSFEWASRIEIPTTATPPALIDFRLHSLTLRDIAGVPAPPLDDTWTKNIISAPITTKVEKVTDSFTLVVPLQSVPTQARFQILISGLPLEANLTLAANSDPAIPCHAEVPDLTSPAYRESGPTAWEFAGWRKYECLIPVANLQAGENTFYLHATSAAPESLIHMNLNIRDALLQLRFPPVSPSPKIDSVVAPQTSTDTIENP